MFKFNFNQNEENEEKEEVIEKDNKPEVIKTSKRVETTSEQYGEIAKSLLDRTFEMFTSNSVEIGFVDNLQSNENGNSDLISGVYEGGFKIWECTQDLADYFTSDEEKNYFMEKTICDLGCSAGILGLLALINGAETVHFQDYNEDVLENFTIPNVILYCEENELAESFSKCSFFFGDWESFKEVSEDEYDIILTSETIYNPAYYAKLLSFFKSRLKKDGKVFLAAKCHYFGVGGNTFDFCKFLDADGVFKHEVLWKSSDGLQREILLIEWK